MKAKFLIIAPAFLLAFASCDNENSNTKTEEKTEVSASKTEVLKLDNGEKWMVNSEMQPFILASEKLTQEYDGKNYLPLAEKLENENKQLISSCTMDGESHEQLHVWLIPHIELIKKLKAAENVESANAVVAELKHSFETFHQFFK